MKHRPSSCSPWRLRQLAAMVAVAAMGSAVASAHGQTPTPPPSKTPPLSGVQAHAVQQQAAPQWPAKAVREVSGLAWDRARAELVGVTDRGWLLRWAVHLSGRADVAVTLTSAVKLAGAAAVNAESVELPPRALGLEPGHVWVMDERRHRVALHAADGQERAEQALPQALELLRPQLQAKGVEAMGWHGQHGLLAVLQQPLGEAAAPVHHQVHAADGRRWVVQGRGGVRSAIKALHVQHDGRVLLLERDTGARPSAYWLHELDVQACQPEQAPCSGPAVRLMLDASRDDNFEGLACLAPDRCLIVSDDGNKPGVGTVFWLLELVRP